MSVFEIEMNTGELLIIPYHSVKEITELNGTITIKYNKTDIAIRTPGSGVSKVLSAFREQRPCQLFYNRGDDTHFHRYVRED
ncbi:MAG: hypothetical protein OEZ23_06110 [Gammaproteobacteria bacterium]|nr:hypothetical protein [Gammaproteobacteria bacterium]